MMKLRHDVLLVVVGLLNLAISSDVLPGPPCDQTDGTCFSNATCDTNNACVCDDSFVMSGDWRKCLPVIANPYQPGCEESSQCSARMGQGATCLERNCVCGDGFHYLHGKCHKSSGYGDPCKVNDDCYAAFSYESMSCIENKCNCSESYYVIGGDYCRRKGKVDEECVFDMDCKFNSSSCVDNICVQKNNGDQKLFSFTGTSKFQHPEDFSKKSPTKILGNACEPSGECTGIANAECFGKVCVCKLGYSNYNNICEPDLGEVCSEAADLNYIPYAECRSNLIRCKAPYIIAENNRECRVGRLYGTQCQVPEQCSISGDHAECVPAGIRNLCQCAAGYHFADEIQLCMKTKGIGEQCDHNYECVVTSGNVDCIDRVCACVEGFHSSKGDCTQDVKALKDPCLDTPDCTAAIGNSSCVSNMCQCKSGYFADPKTDNSCLTGVGGDCADDNECNAVSSTFCDDEKHVCACPNGTIPNMENNKCLNEEADFGQRCEEDKQCYKKLGLKGNACIGGTCSCIEGYHFLNKYCREKRVLGEACEQNSQCYLESLLMNRVECRNGLCQCNYDYIQTQDLDCESGVSGQSASLEFVIGIVMVVLLRETKWN